MKKAISILLVSSMVLAMTACGSSASNAAPAADAAPAAEAAAPADAAPAAEAGEKAKLGFVAPDLNNSFCSNMDAGVKRAAAEYGYEVFDYITQMDPEQDIASVEQLAINGVKAYYGLHMLVDSVGEKLMNEYPEMGCFSQVAFQGATEVVGDDFAVVGEHFIEALDEFLAANNITEAGICGIWLSACQNQGTSEAIQQEAVLKAIEEHYAGTGITYVQSEYPADAEAVGNTAETLLLAHPEATIFFCHNNDFAISVANTISAASSDTSKFFVFASEGDDEARRLIADDASPYRAASIADNEETGYQIGLQLINWVENGKMDPVVVARELVK